MPPSRPSSSRRCSPDRRRDRPRRPVRLVRPGRSARDDPSVLVELAAFEAIQDHATLIDGSWDAPLAGRSGRPCPRAPPRRSASGRRHGSTSQAASGPARQVRVVAHRHLATGPRPTRTGSATPLELDGTATTGRFTTRGPFVIAARALLGPEPGRAVALEWRAIPDLGRLATDQVRSSSANASTACRPEPARRPAAAATSHGRHGPARDPGRGRAIHPRQPQRGHAADDPVRGPRGLRDPARRRAAPRAAADRTSPCCAPAARPRGTPRRFWPSTEVGHPGRRRRDRRPPARRRSSWSGARQRSGRSAPAASQRRRHA